MASATMSSMQAATGSSMQAAAVSSMQAATVSFQLAAAPGAALPNSSRLPLVRIPRSQLPVSYTLRQGKVGNGQCVVSRRQVVVSAEYSSRRSGGGAGDFVAGFLLGGVLFGAIGYLIAPTISKSIAAAEKEIEEDEDVEGPPKKLPKYADDEEGLESTRKSLNEKIAQLNAAIDDVSAQLRADDGSFGINESTVELESAA